MLIYPWILLYSKGFQGIYWITKCFQETQINNIGALCQIGRMQISLLFEEISLLF